jgi:hypothetical protein
MALLDVQKQDLPHGTAPRAKIENMPPAGPHDRPELTNYDACPGCGMLPAQVEQEIDSDPGGG